MLTPADDLRHALAAGPHARESLFYSLLLPDEGLMVFTYTWVGCDNRAGYMFVVAEENGERRAFDAIDGIDIGDADFSDWAVGGLTLRHVDPLERVELDVSLEGVRFSARYDGTHDAFSYLDNEDGCPTFIADDRFEQSCRVVGTLELDGRTIEFDTTGHRDHSWGTRDWDTLQDWRWVSGQAGPGLGLNLLAVHARGHDTVHGYVARDGVTAPIAAAKVSARFDDRFRQTGAEVRITDTTGAVTELSCERFAFFAFEAGERVRLNEAGCTGTIDGRPAVIHMECGWDRSYQDLQASRASAAAAA